jgi:beta-carotene hydroxylase
MAVDEGEPELPPLSDLGADLLEVTPSWRVLSLVSPFVCTGLFFVLAGRGLWWLALPCLAAHTFLTYASVSHDLVHGTLGLSPRANDAMLALVELLGLRSGHAYRASHLFHHRRFPDPEDLEGAPARMSLVRTLLEGPVYLWRLGVSAYRRSGSRERAWIGSELLAVLLLVALALVLWLAGITPIPAVYAGLIVAGSWLFPLVFVYLMHLAEGRNAYFQTRAFRGRVVPALMLHHTYHLEHHLYPMVPARNWRALGQRLDPLLARAGVVPVRLP